MGALPPHKLAFRVDEAAAAIGIGRAKMFAMIAQGEIEARKIGSATVIRRADLEAYLDAAPLADATKRAQSSIR